jgi:hypothetical protein
MNLILLIPEKYHYLAVLFTLFIKLNLKKDMKVIVLFSLFTLLWIGCDFSDTVEGKINIAKGVEIEVVDVEGNDLLDPSTESVSAINELCIFYLRDGNYEEVSLSNGIKVYAIQ